MSAKPTPDSLRDKTAGTVDADAYARLNHVDKAIIEKDRHVVARGHRKVIMVGAGVSGITQAAMLLREKAIKHEDMVILDVQDNFGGVWDKNRYPGCACDVPALLYTNNMMINTGILPSYPVLESILKKTQSTTPTTPRGNRYSTSTFAWPMSMSSRDRFNFAHS